jgi:hypothetical protein
VSIEFRAAVLIAASPAEVWRVFERIEEWPRWWSACRAASVRDGAFDRPGSRLRITLAQWWLPVTFEPIVLEAERARRYVWEGHGGGVTGRHGFELVAAGTGTRVLQFETMVGPAVFLVRALGIAAATQRMFEESLAGLKDAVERDPGGGST